MTRQPNPEPVRPYAWFVLAVFFAAALLSYADRLILNMMVEPIRADLHLTDTGISLTQGAAFAVIYAVVGLPLGRYADRHNRRNLAALGVLVWSAGTLACGLAADFSQLLVARIGVGIGEAALAPCAISILADYFPSHRRGFAIGIFLSGMVAGGGVASFLGGMLLQAIKGGLLAAGPLAPLAPWRAVLVLLAAPGLAIATLLLIVREPVRRDSLGTAHAGFAEIVSYLRGNVATYGLILTAFTLLQVVDYGVTAWLPTLLIRRHGLAEAQIGASMGPILIGCGLGGALLGGFFADVWQARGVINAKIRLAAAGSLLIPPLLLLGVASSADVVLALFAAYALVAAIAGAAGLAGVQDVTPSEMRGFVVALQAFLFTLFGLGGGPTLVAVTTDYVLRDPNSVGVAMTLVAVPLAALAAILLWRSAPAFALTRARLLQARQARAAA